MEELVFGRYHLKHLLRIDSLSTAHYLVKVGNYQTPSHVHDAWELVYCSRGTVDAFQENTSFRLRPHQLIFHRPESHHHLSIGETPATVFVFSFFCRSEYLKLLPGFIMNTDSAQEALLSMILQELTNAFDLVDGHLMLGEFHPSNNAALGAEHLIATYLEGLLISLLRSVSTSEPDVRKWNVSSLDTALENHVTTEIKRYISDHLADKLSIDLLSERLHYSRSYLTSQFRKSEGLSISEYIYNERIENAKRLLLSTALSISQIAEQTGYSTLQYFYKCFRDATGLSPAVFRAQNRQLL